MEQFITMKYDRLTFNKDYYGDTIDFDDLYNRLAELEDKIENGTLVELPCKVGDMVYGYSKNVSRIIYGRLDSIHITDRGVYYTVYEDDGIIQYWLDHVSKIKVEAEKRLEELRGENKEE